MMKFLTVLFVLLYGWRILSQNSAYRKIINDKFIGVKQSELNDIISNGVKEDDEDIILLLLITIWGICLSIIEAFYMLFAFKYGNVYIVLLYIIFWVLILIIKKIRSEINTKRDVVITHKVSKYSIKQLLVHIVDLMFFIYMFIKIFLN